MAPEEDAPLMCHWLHGTARGNLDCCPAQKILCSVAVALLLLYPLVPESPHWLAVKGDVAGADAVLRRVAAVNGAQLPPGRLEGPVGLTATSAASERRRRCNVTAVCPCSTARREKQAQTLEGAIHEAFANNLPVASCRAA